MTDACARTRERLGPYLLGHLDEPDRLAFEAHLEGCEACRTERDALRPVARLLTTVDPDRLGERPRAPADLGRRVFAGIERERAERRRRRGLAAVAAAAILAAAVPVALLLGRSGDGTEVLSFQHAPRGVRASAAVDARPWGTEIVLEVSGLRGGEEYAVWMEDLDGGRIPAGTFRAVSGRTMEVVLASALPRSGAHGLGVSDDSGETVLYARMPGTSPSPNADR